MISVFGALRELLSVNRPSLFYEPMGESEENVRLMRLLDEQYTKAPFYGSRRMTEWLITQGYEVNRKRISRLMEVMGIEVAHPKPKLSQFRRRPQDLPVPVERSDGRPSQSGLEHRYHVYQDE